MKKYEFTGETKEIRLLFRTATLHRIRATVAFGIVEVGDLGGWIEKEENLSHEGKAWVCGDAKVWGNANVCGDVTKLGANWNNGLNTSAFYWNLNNASSNRNRNISSQLVNAQISLGNTPSEMAGCSYKSMY